jgi:hypothetical protein
MSSKKETEEIDWKDDLRSIPNPDVDYVIDIPDSWYKQPHRKKMRFFIPEWDDRVDPDYGFEGEIKPHRQSAWHNTVYAHQLYETPNYDGILVSKVVAEKGEEKRKYVNELGIHRYLRVPREFPVFGDCGAFDYIGEDDPPFETEEMLNYYTRLDFDYGVSLDHLILDSSDIEKRNYRYNLTIKNARDFIKGHKKLSCEWVPIGAVQGWSPDSYAKAAKKIVAMGYSYIALGGLVRSKTAAILEILKAVRKSIPKDIDIHMFGVARLDAIPEFLHYGVSSVDSASQLRTAWLGSTKNFMTDKQWYSAIRIPQTEGSFRARQLVDQGDISFPSLQKLEKKCLDELRKYAKLERPPSKTLIKCLGEYDALVSPTRKKGMARIDKILSGMDRVVIPRKETWYIDWIKPQSHEKYARTREKALAWDDISSAELNKMERECYKALKKFLKLKGENIETRRAVANLIFDYEYAVLGYRSISKARIRETLMARPWNHADCAVCKDVGVETIIFRGNNRNRRRGFHNSFVFYQKFKDRVKNYKKYIDLSRSGQQDLFR